MDNNQGPKRNTRPSVYLLDKNTYYYYCFLYQNQNHMLVRISSFFKYKLYKWFRLTDTHLLLFPKKSSTTPKSSISFDKISFQDASSVLKGYQVCIKLSIQNQSPYYLHFNNENEKHFFVRFLKNDKKLLNLLPIESSHNIKPSTPFDHVKVEPPSSELKPNPVFYNFETLCLVKPESFLSEEDIPHDMAQEGFVNNENIRSYHQIYHKPKIAYLNLKSDRSQKKNDSQNLSEHECMSYDGYFIRLPKPKEKQSFGNLSERSIRHLGSNLSSPNSTQKLKSFDGSGTPQGDFKPLKKQEVIPRISIRSFTADTERLYEFQRNFSKLSARISIDEKDEHRLSMYSKKIEGPHVDSRVISPVSSTDPNDEKELDHSTFHVLRTSQTKKRHLSSDNTPRVKKNLDRFYSIKKSLRKVGLTKAKSYFSSFPYIAPNQDFEAQLRAAQDLEEAIFVIHKLMWNYELEEARKCINVFLDHDVLFELLMVENEILSIATTGAKSQIKKILDMLQNIHNKVSSANFTVKDDPEKYFCNELHKAEVCIYRGALHFFLGNKFQLFKTIAEGWRCFKRLEALLEKTIHKEALSQRSLHRFNFGLGSFHLILSLIPPGILKLMKFFGLVDSNKEKGIQLLQLCRTESDIRSNYAIIILTLYTIEFELKLEKACEIMIPSLESFPGCPLFFWLASIISWKHAQPTDAYFLIKTALLRLGSSAEHAVYLKYELAWFYFLNMKWDLSLAIFKKIACGALPQQFFNHQVHDVTLLVKTLKLSFNVDFKKFNEGLNSVSDDQISILPYLSHIAVKIAACHFNLGNFELAIKWLLSSVIIFKNYSFFKSRQEEDFSKLAIKFLGRCSMNMLVFEVIYFMKYMPKLSDSYIMEIIEKVEEYQTSLTLDEEQLNSYLKTNSKEDPLVIEYLSTVLIKVVGSCLLGDTDIACEVFKANQKYFPLLSEEYAYIISHTEYWASRALISENNPLEAKAMLKALLKKKKGEFSLNSRARKILSEL